MATSGRGLVAGLDPLEPRDVQQSPAFPDWSFSFLDFRGAGDSF